MASMTAWRPLERVAGLGGLILDWQSWQPAGSAPAPDENIVALGRADGMANWAGAPTRRHAVRDAIGIDCRVWPPAQGRYVYAAARLRASQTLDCVLRLGSYVGYRVWLDGALIAEAAPGPFFDVDDNCCVRRVAAGRHALLVELDRTEWQTVFHARLSLLEGGDLPARVYAAEAYRRIRRAYALAEAEERLDIEVFARGHRFSGRRAFPFLERWLAADAR
jgi:hypothetical protein